MKIFLYFLAFFHLYSFSDDRKEVQKPSGFPGQPLPIVLQIENSTQAKQNWFSADASHVKNANCSKQVPISIEEMETWLKNQENRTGVNINQFGIKLENESLLLAKSIIHLLSPGGINRITSDKPDISKIPADCKKALCTAKAIFGDQIGTKLLFMKSKYGMNGSPYSFTNSAHWKPEELDDVLLALSDFPESSLNNDSGKQLTRYTRGKTHSNDPDGKNFANAMISLFDLWESQTPQDRRISVFHEMCHFLASEIGDSESVEWLNFSDWRKTIQIEATNENEIWEKNQNAMVSNYGAENPYEDFAESCLAYRYNPQLLKKISPKKYNFMRETIFDGVEYLSASACANPDLISKKLNNLSKEKKLVVDAHTKESLTFAQKNCGRYILQLANGWSQELEKCVQESLSKQTLLIAADSMAFEFPNFTKTNILKRPTESFYSNDQSKPIVDKVLSDIRLDFIKVATAVDELKQVELYKNTAGKTVNQFCSEWSQDSYLKIDQKDFDQKYSHSNTFFLRSTDIIDNRMNDICINIQSQKKYISPPSQKEIENAVSNIIR